MESEVVIKEAPALPRSRYPSAPERRRAMDRPPSAVAREELGVQGVCCKSRQHYNCKQLVWPYVYTLLAEILSSSNLNHSLDDGSEGSFASPPSSIV